MIINQSAKKKSEILHRAEGQIALNRQLFPSRTRPARLEEGDVFMLFHSQLSHKDDCFFSLSFIFFSFFFFALVGRIGKRKLHFFSGIVMPMTSRTNTQLPPLTKVDS